jgi:hypothetical protein
MSNFTNLLLFGLNIAYMGFAMYHTYLISPGQHQPWLTIKPSNCDRSQFPNNDDAALKLDSQGWFLDTMGICPFSGIDKDKGAFKGCIDYSNGALWADMDAKNAAAGVQTDLVGGAGKVKETVSNLLLAGIVLLWIAGPTAFVSFGKNPPSELDGPRTLNAVVVLVISIAIALCYITALTTFMRTDLVKGSSFEHSLFKSCTVTVSTATPTGTFVVHIVMICFYGFVLFETVRVLISIHCPMGDMCYDCRDLCGSCLDRCRCSCSLRISGSSSASSSPSPFPAPSSGPKSNGQKHTKVDAAEMEIRDVETAFGDPPVTKITDEQRRDSRKSGKAT